MRYDVVVVGFRLNASLKPAQALQKVLGLDPDTCKELTRQFPANVLSGVSQSRAERVADDLTDAGAKVEVRRSRLSLADEQATDTAAQPRDEASGNYEIGEILPPVSARASSPANELKRPSREELDQALREELPTAGFVELPEARAQSQSSSGYIELPDESRTSTPSFELMDNAAFAGMQSFGEGFDNLGIDEKKPAPRVQVDEVALQSIRRRPDPSSARKHAPTTFAGRLARKLRALLADVFGLSMAVLSLLVVCLITLLAVGYALDPNDMVGAIRTLVHF